MILDSGIRRGTDIFKGARARRDRRRHQSGPQVWGLRRVPNHESGRRGRARDILRRELEMVMRRTGTTNLAKIDRSYVVDRRRGKDFQPERHRKEWTGTGGPAMRKRAATPPFPLKRPSQVGSGQRVLALVLAASFSPAAAPVPPDLEDAPPSGSGEEGVAAGLARTGARPGVALARKNRPVDLAALEQTIHVALRCKTTPAGVRGD
ncbi:MAG: alpha-hydroxy-acid oxidizing protein [Acidobacteria bacterium]|nr:alpha-hydroxy-acid oxidizing protein [Acidobacteriota bacterium]